MIKKQQQFFSLAAAAAASGNRFGSLSIKNLDDRGLQLKPFISVCALRHNTLVLYDASLLFRVSSQSKEILNYFTTYSCKEAVKL